MAGPRRLARHEPESPSPAHVQRLRESSATPKALNGGTALQEFWGKPSSTPRNCGSGHRPMTTLLRV